MSHPALDAHLDHLVRRAESAVAHRFADARSHLAMDAPDLAGLADRRLADLADALTGIVADARESGYRAAFAATPFDPAKHDPAWQYPTSAGIRAVRAGTSAARDEIDAVLARSRRTIPLVMGDRDAIDVWHEQGRQAVTRWAKAAISDHQVRTFHVVAHVRHKAELLGRA